MIKTEFDEMMKDAEYGVQYEVKFNKVYSALKLMSNIMHWLNVKKMRHLICYRREGKSVIIRRFWHNQPGVNIVREYYDELTMREIDQLVHSPMFKK